MLSEFIMIYKQDRSELIWIIYIYTKSIIARSKAKRTCKGRARFLFWEIFPVFFFSEQRFSKGDGKIEWHTELHKTTNVVVFFI